MATKQRPKSKAPRKPARRKAAPAKAKTATRKPVSRKPRTPKAAGLVRTPNGTFERIGADGQPERP